MILKYRDLRTVLGPGNIQIILGHPIGRGTDTARVPVDAKITDAEVEEGEGPKTISKGKDILTDDEVDIDV